MMISFSAVPPVALIERWPEVEPLLAKSMPVDLKRYLPIDILAALIREGQTTQAWFAREGDQLIAVLVTQIHQFPRRRGCSIFCLAGTRMAEWFGDAEAMLTEYAIRCGCDHFETQGRRGWERYLALEPRSIVLVKEIGPAANNNNGGSDA
jgi:hypothetical protein